MTGYSIALFVHIIGVIVMFIALGIGQRTGLRMRGAASVDHARLWMGLLKVTTPMFPTALVLLLGSGLFMTAEAWSFTTPWVAVAVTAVVVVGAFGTWLIMRGFSRMDAILERAASGELTDDVRSVLDDTGTWASMYAVNAMSIAVLWLMAVKPGWLHSIVLATAVTLIGGVLGVAATRRHISR